MKEKAGYNIMKDQAYQETDKSTFALKNGSKIIK
jgi:hypothetical protein